MAINSQSQSKTGRHHYANALLKKSQRDNENRVKDNQLIVNRQGRLPETVPFERLTMAFNWQNALVQPDTQILDVLSVIDKTSNRAAFVVDGEQRLQGIARLHYRMRG